MRIIDRAKLYSAYGLNAEGYQRLANRMNHEASESNWDDFILITAQDIYSIVRCMRHSDRRRLIQLFPALHYSFKIAKKINVVLVYLNDQVKRDIITAIEAFGEHKEEFEFLKEFVRWYGIRRIQYKVFNNWIPADPRPGYLSNEYDGTNIHNFTYEDIHLDTEDEEAKEEWLAQQCCP